MANGKLVSTYMFFFRVICYLSSISYLKYKIITILIVFWHREYLQGYQSRFQSAKDFVMSVMFANYTGES